MEEVNNINQIKLEPGDTLFFERNFGSEKIKIRAPYVGSLRDKYILSEMPATDKGPLFQSVDTKCTVRFIARGTIYGFNSYIVSITHSPLPLIYIAYPEKIEKINLRKEDRFKVFLPTVLGFVDSEKMEEQEGTIVDLSKSGCRLITPVFCDTGDKVSIKFKLKENSLQDPIKGMVRNSRPSGVDNYELGVEFSEAHREVEDFIMKLHEYLGNDE